jgi:hypothetical protein
VTVRELFESRERPALVPLPERPFELVEWKDAKVHPDCHVAIDRVLYSVPWQHVGKTLQAKVSAALVELHDGDVLVKTHVRDARAAEIGTGTAALVDGLLEQGGPTRLREVQALLRLSDTDDAARLEAACALALTADGRMKTVRNILEAALDRRQLEFALPVTSAGAFVHGAAAIVGRPRHEHAAAAATP